VPQTRFHACSDDTPNPEHYLACFVSRKISAISSISCSSFSPSAGSM
jgi:hypothetical protein